MNKMLRKHHFIKYFTIIMEEPKYQSLPFKIAQLLCYYFKTFPTCKPLFQNTMGIEKLKL